MGKPIEQLSIALATAWQSGELLDFDTALELSPTNNAEAYQVQMNVARKLGWFANDAPQAWKLGGPLGGSTAAPVPQSAIVHRASGKTARLSTADQFDYTALEVELIIRLGQDLPAGCTLEEAKRAICEVYLGVEVCDSRAPGWKALPPTFHLADRQMNRGLILSGVALAGWCDEMATIAPKVTLNNQIISEGPLHHPQGHPLGALPWLANLAQTFYGQPLRAGTLIATGTWNGLHLLNTNDHFSIELDGFTPFQIKLLAPNKHTSTLLLQPRLQNQRAEASLTDRSFTR